MVIKGVDRGRWVTISRVAVPLKVGAAVAAEVAGVCVLTGILDLVSSSASTESSTNNDVAICELVFCKK